MYKKLAWLGWLLALTVILVGASIRFSDVEAGCPDWPVCYGELFLQYKAPLIEQAKQAFPDRPVNIIEAWKEMGYRYSLASLAVISLLLLLFSSAQRHYRLKAMVSGLLLCLGVGGLIAINFYHNEAQNSTSHWLQSFGYLIELFVFWILYHLTLYSDKAQVSSKAVKGLTTLCVLAAITLFLEISTGIWTSTNAAAFACPDFPKCYNEWWPEADYQGAIDLFNPLIADEQAGKDNYLARVAIHWLHRVGALVSLVMVLLLVIFAASSKNSSNIRRTSFVLGVFLAIEVILGVLAIKWRIPLALVVAHSGFAALLMLPILKLRYYTRLALVEQKTSSAREVTAKPAPKKIPPEIDGQPVIEEAAADEIDNFKEPEQLFSRLKNQLGKTRSGLSDALWGWSFGEKGINSELLENIEFSLIMADVGVEATNNIINNLSNSIKENRIADEQALKSELKSQLLDILQPCSKPLTIKKKEGPFVILVVGVNGVGKTTTIGKLAKRIQSQGHSVMLAAGDTFRAAAVEQLQTWGERNNIPVVAQHTGADSASVVFDGVQSAQAKGIDVLIADTAGRLHTKANLMEELKKIKRIIGKLDASAPHEVLLVLDAGTGQNALAQTKQFNETVDVTGIVLSKLDGTAKGGVIFALARQFGIPIPYIGIGEGIDDLQDFNAEQFIDALFVQQN